MTDYIEVRFGINPYSQDAADLLAALMGERGFDSFAEDPEGLLAYIPENLFNENLVVLGSDEWPFASAVTSSWHSIPGQDWNAEWEKNYFKPIVIDDRCVIHSSFHQDFPVCPVDIVIDPKMAFGTGHHATTSLIVTQLLDSPPVGKRVIDMGTGTGILAILSEKLGAKSVVAVEIDPVAYENTLENIVLNGCNAIDVRLGDVSAIEGEEDVDLLIANINRNVILADLSQYVSHIAEGGKIILSGFLLSDVEMCVERMKALGITRIEVSSRGEWASIAGILS